MGSAGYAGNFVTRGVVQSSTGIVANDPENAVNPLTRLDSHGKPLDGANKHRLTFPAGGLPEVSEFWLILRPR